MQTNNIILAGTPSFAATIFEALIKDNCYNIKAVYTQPDRPSGRGKIVNVSAVKQLALKHELPIYQPLTLKTEEEIERFKTLVSNLDLMIVIAYGQILPTEVLMAPRLGCINIHASLLPRWRGAAPIPRAIEAGDSTTGITVMQMDKGLDTGAMLLKASCDISEVDTTLSLQQKLETIAIKALKQTLRNISNVKAQPQNEKQACYAKKIKTSEAKIDWSLTAEHIHRKIRAYYPAPGAYSFIDGTRLKIGEAMIKDSYAKANIGMIIECNSNEVWVQCGKGALALTKVQLPGKKMMPYHDLLQGNAKLFKTGKVFE